MAMAASTLLLPVAAGWADGESAARTFAASIALTTASGIVSGASSGLFLAQFGILMSKFSAKATAAIAALGYLCMSALFCLFSFFGPFESCLFAASMPIASSFLRDVGASTQKSKRAINDKPLPAQIEPANPENRRQLRHLTLALALCCALIGCANELARTLYIQMGIAGAGGQHYAFIQAGAALVMMAAMAFTEHDLAFAVNLLPTDRKRRFSDKCLAVAARCGLSERETEIMTLFAKGRNLAYIQDQLCLSKSTVSTHRQHIYQKLGVHSSQEMIDLIQEEKA